jgi:hypothetical protein
MEMSPTEGQVRLAAYSRWESRGRVHGFDRADWLAAERHQRFVVNYDVVAAERLDSNTSRAIGVAARRRCRFCGQASPRTTFEEAGCPVFPVFLGARGPIAFDQCDECRQQFGDGIDLAFAHFLRPYRDGSMVENEGIAVDAFKGLLKLAIAVMPPGDVDDHEDLIEWLSNPDHAFDLNAFRQYACSVHVSPSPFSAAWSALASRTSDEEGWPLRLFFLGAAHVTLQIPVPFGALEDETISTPDVLPPSPFGPESDPIANILLPIVATGMGRCVGTS